MEEGDLDLRLALKMVRDINNHAWDVLPNGELIGEFANRHAVRRYSRKVENKRLRARETRKQRRSPTDAKDEPAAPPKKARHTS